MATQVGQGAQQSAPPAQMDMEDAPPLQVRLVSQDGREFVVPVDVARVSITVRTMLDDLPGIVLGEEGGAPEEGSDKIPLLNVKGDVLERVIAWATHHKDDPPFEDDEDATERRSDDVSPWDADFLKDIQQSVLFDLILAANYLDIKGLLDCSCKTVANMIKGKTPEEIRQTFGIQNDFTPAEEEQIRKENEWCEEK